MTAAISLPLTPADQVDLRLGLIGDNIAASRSPALHRLAGQLCGLRVSYDLLIPPRLGQGFEAVLDAARAAGLSGVNVTLPYKEQVLRNVTVRDPGTRRIGAVNTVRFGPDGAQGYNTDHSGFIAAFRAAFGATSPGRVVVIGTGGVGRALAFALLDLGAAEIIFVDKDMAKAVTLAKAVLSAAEGRTRVRVGDLSDLSAADGVVNATPIGMVGYPGSPVPEGTFPRAVWAFDAVYTPAETVFRGQALSAGARFLSGWELFFHQGIDAFEIFTGHRPDAALLRAALGDAPPAA